MKKSIFAALFTLIFIFVGCGGGDRESGDRQYHDKSRAESKTIANVGQSEIKLFLMDEYTKMYNASFNSAEEEYEAKKAYLDSLINMYIFVEAAYDQGLDKDPEIQQQVEIAYPDFMRDELFKLKILPRIDVTDEEVEQWYNELDEEVAISIIYLTDSLKADSLYNEARNGADFAAMARKHSEDQASAVKGGDIGYRTFVSLSETFQNQVWDLNEGEITLVKAPTGWNIATVTGRREVQVPPLDQIATQLKSQIQGMKRKKVQTEFYDDLYEKADIKINEETTEFIYDKVSALYPDEIGGVPFRKNTFNPDDLAEYERNMILATYNGGEVTLGEYLRNTARWPDQQRPPFNETEELKDAVFQLELLDILLNEAEALDLDETADFKDVERFFMDNMLAVRMKEIVTEERSFVSDEEVAEYYRQNANQYTIPKKLHVQEILLETEMDAEKIYQRLEQGEDFEKLAIENTTRPGYKEAKGDMGFISEHTFPTIYDQAEKLRLNRYSEPFPVGNSWSIVKLLEVREPEVREFEQVANQIKRELQNQKSEKATADWLAENRNKFQVDADYDMIWETIDKGKYE